MLSFCLSESLRTRETNTLALLAVLTVVRQIDLNQPLVSWVVDSLPVEWSMTNMIEICQHSKYNAYFLYIIKPAHETRCPISFGGTRNNSMNAVDKFGIPERMLEGSVVRSAARFCCGMQVDIIACPTIRRTPQIARSLRPALVIAPRFSDSFSKHTVSTW